MNSPLLFKLVSKLKDLHLDVTFRLVFQDVRVGLSWAMFRVLPVLRVRRDFVAWSEE